MTEVTEHHVWSTDIFEGVSSLYLIMGLVVVV